MNFRLKITINLAPADLPKEGGRYDLPIAVALLAASEQLTASNLEAYELVGELALTGALRGVLAQYQVQRKPSGPAEILSSQQRTRRRLGLSAKKDVLSPIIYKPSAPFWKETRPGKTFSSGYGIVYRNCRSSRCDRSGAG